MRRNLGVVNAAVGLVCAAEMTILIAQGNFADAVFFTLLSLAGSAMAIILLTGKD